jgi:predicted RNA binding protein YcfA (HicA-like mRNA interferase family)
MGNLPVVSSNEAITAFERLGWIIRRQRSSHIILSKPGLWYNLAIPIGKEVKLGTLRGLLRDAGISVNEFRHALGLD